MIKAINKQQLPENIIRKLLKILFEKKIKDYKLLK